MPAMPPGPNSQHTVLVVDDENDLREAMCLGLQRRGFLTLSATGPRAAVELCEDHDGPVDVLVTDLTLPGIPGRQLAALLTTMRPWMRVLYVSGWSREVAVDRGLLDPWATVVQKPFTADRLAAEVRAALVDVDAEVSTSPR